MINRIRNRYLRGLLGWAVVLGFVALFPFFAIYGAAVDAWNNIRFTWLDSKKERLNVWRVLTFRKGTA